jgi:hypothetical protein
MGQPTSDDLKYGASRVELYRCTQCGSETRFPRYKCVVCTRSYIVRILMLYVWTGGRDCAWLVTYVISCCVRAERRCCV